MNKEVVTKKIFNRYKYSVSTIMSNILFWVCVYFSLFLLAFSICFTSSYVSGDSMRPTINNYADFEHKKDIVYIDKYAQYERGDIIVIAKPKMQIIKRVIAVAGDTINIVAKPDAGGKFGYYVERNGQLLDEDSYIRQIGDINDYNGMYNCYQSFLNFKQDNPSLNYTDTGALVVGEGEIFVLGDNRINSEDSSEEGCFKTNKVVGKVEIIVKHNQNLLFELFKYFFWPF